MEGTNANSGNAVLRFINGLIYHETTKPKTGSESNETITTKTYNWTGITILSVGSGLLVFGIAKIAQNVLNRK